MNLVSLYSWASTSKVSRNIKYSTKPGFLESSHIFEVVIITSLIGFAGIIYHSIILRSLLVILSLLCIFLTGEKIGLRFLLINWWLTCKWLAACNNYIPTYKCMVY